MTYLLVNRNFPEEFAKKISPYGEVLRVPEFSLLDFPVSAHPDMLAVNVAGRLFIHKENASLAAMLEERGVPFSLSSAPAGKKYPADIALNLFVLQNFLFANLKHASQEVLEHARTQGIEYAHIPQGYAKCSAMLLGNAIVTADKSIHAAALERGIDALLISPGSIGIEKYDTGFIGGASATLEKGKTAVFGNILSHPDGEKILDFAAKHGEQIVSLGEGKPFDYGGIVRIDT